MLCIYVGKGKVVLRIKDHIAGKLNNTNEKFTVGFFGCDNRIANYLEQLFLDIYEFYHNKNEDLGKDYLYTMLDEDIYLLGIEIDNDVQILEKKYPDIFNPH